MVRRTVRDCERCGCRLSRYNPDGSCSACTRSGAPEEASLPGVPERVWQHADVRHALAELDFGLASRLIRERGSLRQEDVARLTGLSQAFLSMLESGRRRLTNIDKIIEFLEGVGAPAGLVRIPLRRPSVASPPRSVEPPAAALAPHRAWNSGLRVPLPALAPAPVPVSAPAREAVGAGDAAERREFLVASDSAGLREAADRLRVTAAGAAGDARAESRDTRPDPFEYLLRAGSSTADERAPEGAPEPASAAVPAAVPAVLRAAPGCAEPARCADRAPLLPVGRQRSPVAPGDPRRRDGPVRRLLAAPAWSERPGAAGVGAGGSGCGAVEGEGEAAAAGERGAARVDGEGLPVGVLAVREDPVGALAPLA